MGYLVVFEGVEGSGKTTQLELARKGLERLGLQIVVTKEPGGTPLAHEIRQILLANREEKVDVRCELLLYQAARAQLYAEVILPALASGSVVLCDRGPLSTLAYQGYGKGMNKDWVDNLSASATTGRAPDLTVVIDVPVEVGLERIRQRGAIDRMEAESVAFHESVRRGFLTEAKFNPNCLVIDGTGKTDTVAGEIYSHLVERLVGKPRMAACSG